MREVIFAGIKVDWFSTWEANEIEEGATVSLIFNDMKIHYEIVAENMKVVPHIFFPIRHW